MLTASLSVRYVRLSFFYEDVASIALFHKSLHGVFNCTLWVTSREWPTNRTPHTCQNNATSKAKRQRLCYNVQPAAIARDVKGQAVLRSKGEAELAMCR